MSGITAKKIIVVIIYIFTVIREIYHNGRTLGRIDNVDNPAKYEIGIIYRIVILCDCGRMGWGEFEVAFDSKNRAICNALLGSATFTWKLSPLKISISVLPKGDSNTGRDCNIRNIVARSSAVIFVESTISPVIIAPIFMTTNIRINWLPCVQLLAHTNLGGVSEFSQENKYSWPRKPRHLRSSEDMKIHKKVSGQENNLFLTTDNQLLALLVFLLVEERF